MKATNKKTRLLGTSLHISQRSHSERRIGKWGGI